jgi:Bax protein
LLAQAALESGWGNSRFALEGKNLFGIRTYDLREPHMLPSNKPKKWGVRVYQHECDSVQHYIDIINNGSAYEEYRKLRDNGVEDSLQYVETLGAYASDKHYFSKIKSIIKKLREEYDIPQLD